MVGLKFQFLSRQIAKFRQAPNARLPLFAPNDRATQISRLASQKARSHYKLAENRCELAGAFRLTYRKYITAGLIEPNAHQLRVTPFHLLRSTHVFIATHKGQLTCTLTLVGDGARGLPMECVYHDEVNQKRAEGFSVAEVSCLAFEPRISKRVFRTAFLQLSRLMYQFARHGGVDGLLIAIHPRHVPLYQRTMGFEQIGSLRSHPSVRNHPAVACWLEFAKADSERPPCYEPIFGKLIPASQLRSKPISVEDRCYFDPVSQTAGPWLPMAAAC